MIAHLMEERTDAARRRGKERGAQRERERKRREREGGRRRLNEAETVCVCMCECVWTEPPSVWLQRTAVIFTVAPHLVRE